MQFLVRLQRQILRLITKLLKKLQQSASELKTKKDTAFAEISKAVKTLQSIGAEKLKAWDGTKAANEAAYNAMKTINDKLGDIKGDSQLAIEAKDGSKLTIDPDRSVNVTILAGSNNTEVTKTKLEVDESTNTFKVTDSGASGATIAKIFDDKNAKGVWQEFITGFSTEHDKLTKERADKLNKDIKDIDNDIDTKAEPVLTEEIGDGKKITYDGVGKNFAAFEKLYEKKIAKETEKLTDANDQLAEANKKVNKAISEIDANKVTLDKNDLESIKAQEGKIDAAITKLGETFSGPDKADKQRKALVEAVEAGIPIVKDGKKLTKADIQDKTKLKDTDLDTVIGSSANDGAQKAAADAKTAVQTVTALEASDVTPAKTKVSDAENSLKIAKYNLTKFNKQAAGVENGIGEAASNLLKEYKDNLDPEKVGSEANKKAKAEKEKATKEKELAAAVKAFKEGTNKDKVALKGTDADSIKAQLEAITKAETAIGAAGTSEKKQKAAIEAAIEAGVPVTNGTKKLSASDVAGLKDTDLAAALNSATTNTTAAKNAVTTDLNTKVTAVKDQDDIIEKANKTIADQKAKVKEISNARATAIATSENLNKGESDVLSALSDIFDSNARVEAIIAGEDADDIAEGVNELHSTLDSATKSLNKGNFTDIVIFNTNLATNTRLAKLSNPYNGNLALAYAVKNMAGEKFADNGSDALSSVVKEYTNRYNYDNNLWGNVFGGKAKVKDAANTDVYGFTLGYDKAFDNTIVGGFFTLAKAQSDGNNVKNDADNYSFGVYTRSYFGQNELDSKFAYGFAKNTLKTKSSLIGDNEGKYDSKYFDIALDYGYVFDIGNAKFVKPIFGLEYTNLKNDSFTAGGPVDLNFAKTSVKTLNAKLGAEFRAYTEKGDYFYVTPGIERELSKSADDSVLNFAGSRNVTFDADKKKYTYATLKTGAEFKITDSLSTNINFGVKARSKNQFYNGTLGLSYKF